METNMNNRLELIYIKKDKLKKLDNNPRVQIDDSATGKLRALIYVSTAFRTLCRCTRRTGSIRSFVVFTDPPYGMNLETDFSKRDRGKGLMGKRQFEDNAKLKRHNYSKIIGDDRDYDPAHLFDMFPKVKEMFLWGADYYAERIPDKNKGSWIVWDKRAGIEQVEFTLSEFETCWSNKKHARRLSHGSSGSA
jgi:hypothetical protein